MTNPTPTVSAYLERPSLAGVERLPLDQSPIVIGRASDAKIRLASDAVSRQHARLTAMDNGGWRIDDLESGNGVRVNDSAIKSHDLQHGDVIVIGDQVLSYRQVTGEVTRPSLFLRLSVEDTAGREVAWEEFYDRYAPIIAGFARRLGASITEAEDLVQAVVSGFYTALPRFVYDPSKGRFRGYLKVATLNAMRASISKRRVIGITAEGLERVADNGAPAWEEVWQRETLSRALAETRDAYENNATFRAFERYAILGEEPAEVARELGITVDSVYQAKRRVTEALRQKVAQYDQQ